MSKPKKKREITWCSMGPNADSPWINLLENDKNKMVRCPKCGKRLKAKPLFCIGGEFVGYKFPKHKNKGWESSHFFSRHEEIKILKTKKMAPEYYTDFKSKKRMMKKRLDCLNKRARDRVKALET